MANKQLVALSFLFLICLPQTFCALQYWGVNQSGAEFGTNLPGTYGTDYTYPYATSVSTLAQMGMNIIRLPFLWERIQPTLFTPLDSVELGRLSSNVTYITQTANMFVLLDVHNYAMYYHTYIGTPAVNYSSFANLWSQLATQFKSNPKVLFGLMNEPHDFPTENWLVAANAAIAAIRATGATNIITVPGNAYTGAHSWLSSVNGFTANAAVMGGIVDPMNNFYIEVHEYLDSDFSGTHPTCSSPTSGSQGLEPFTQWARSKGFKALIGEFAGTATDPVCVQAIPDMLNYVINNQDVYVGWTWWSSGPWWGTYMFDLEPGSSTAPALTAIVKPFIGLTTPVTLQTVVQQTLPTYPPVTLPPYTPPGGTPAGNTPVNGNNQNQGAGGNNAGVIAGSVIGVLAFVGLVAAGIAVFVVMRRRRGLSSFPEIGLSNILPVRHNTPITRAMSAPVIQNSSPVTHSPPAYVSASSNRSSGKPLPPLPQAPNRAVSSPAIAQKAVTPRQPTLPRSLRMGDSVMAKYSGDGNEYRAVIMQVNEGANTYKVRYVDFGDDSEWVVGAHVRAL